MKKKNLTLPSYIFQLITKYKRIRFRSYSSKSSFQLLNTNLFNCNYLIIYCKKYIDSVEV